MSYDETAPCFIKQAPVQLPAVWTKEVGGGALCEYARLRPRLYAGTLPQAPGQHWRLTLHTMLLPALPIGGLQLRGLCFRETVCCWESQPRPRQNALKIDYGQMMMLYVIYVYIYIYIYVCFSCQQLLSNRSLCKIVLLQIKIPESHHNVTSVFSVVLHKEKLWGALGWNSSEE